MAEQTNMVMQKAWAINIECHKDTQEICIVKRSMFSKSIIQALFQICCSHITVGTRTLGNMRVHNISPYGYKINDILRQFNIQWIGISHRHKYKDV